MRELTQAVTRQSPAPAAQSIFSREVLDEVMGLAPLMDAYFLGLQDARTLLERAVRSALGGGKAVEPGQVMKDLVAQAQTPSSREQVLREFVPGAETPIGEVPGRLAVRVSDETLFGQLRDDAVINRYWTLRVHKGLTPAEYLFAAGKLASFVNGGTLAGEPFDFFQGPRIKLDLFIQASSQQRAATIERLARPLAGGLVPASGPAADLANVLKVLRRIDAML